MEKQNTCSVQLPFFLGLDVSKLTIDVCLLSSDGTKKTLKIANSKAGFVQLLSYLHGLDFEQVNACMEPTGRYSRPLSEFLVGAGIKVSMVNCHTVKDHARSKNIRNKTDRLDSYILADYCMMHKPPAWMPPSTIRMELRDVQNRITNVTEEILQEKNRLEAGVESDFVRDDIEENLGRLMVRKMKLEEYAQELIQSDPRLHNNFKILKSIIGIGDTAAIVMLSLIGFNDFSDGRKVGAYAGLAPIFEDSGTSVRSRPRISRAGSSRLRGALYFPALSAMQHNPQLREFAERLKAKNKPMKVIICAVMRKLLVLSSTLIRKQEFYDPTFGI
jgi:transposase